MLTRANALDVPTVTWRALSKRAPIAGHRRVVVRSGVDHLEVRSVGGDPVPVQVDGDYMGLETEARFTLTRGGLWVLA